MCVDWKEEDERTMKVSLLRKADHQGEEVDR